MTDGDRLKSWRDSLPLSPQGHVMSRNALSLAAGWSETRWGRLEDAAAWPDHHREQVAQGVRAIASRLDVPPATVDACVAHVLDGAPAPELGAWREGECPARPMGRPRRGARTSRQASDERPILPPQVHRAQVAAILRTVRAGQLDERTALEAIEDVYEPLRDFYNKLPGRDGTAA